MVKMGSYVQVRLLGRTWAEVLLHRGSTYQRPTTLLHTLVADERFDCTDNLIGVPQFHSLMDYDNDSHFKKLVFILRTRHLINQHCLQ